MGTLGDIGGLEGMGTLGDIEGGIVGDRRERGQWGTGGTKGMWRGSRWRCGTAGDSGGHWGTAGAEWDWRDSGRGGMWGQLEERGR